MMFKGVIFPLAKPCLHKVLARVFFLSVSSSSSLPLSHPPSLFLSSIASRSPLLVPFFFGRYITPSNPKYAHAIYFPSTRHVEKDVFTWGKEVFALRKTFFSLFFLVREMSVFYSTSREVKINNVILLLVGGNILNTKH